MKKLTVLLLATLTFTAYGQSDDSKNLVTGTLGAVAVGSGGVSIHKFVKANKLTKNNTKIILAHTGTEGKALSDEDIARNCLGMEEGDRITITYHGSEATNRARWAQEYREQAQSAQNMAAHYRLQAADALKRKKDIYENIPDPQPGNPHHTKRVKVDEVPDPDMIGWTNANTLASQEDDKAIQLASKAGRVEAGAEKVPWWEFAEEMEGAAAHSANVAKRISGIIKNEGGKIFSINKLPKAIVKEVTSANTIGGITAGISVLSAGAAIYNHVTGKISGSLASESKGRLDSDRSNLAGLDKSQSVEEKNKTKSAGSKLIN